MTEYFFLNPRLYFLLVTTHVMYVDIIPLYCVSAYTITKLDILFSSNHNIHKSSCGLCFWASDPLIDRFW